MLSVHQSRQLATTHEDNIMSFFYNLNKTLDGIANKADTSQLNERDMGKHNNATTGFRAVADKAAKSYGSKAAGERVAGAQFQKMKKAGQLEEGCSSCGCSPCSCNEGNAFSGAVAKAKSNGIQPGEKINVGGKEYPVKEEGMSAADKSFAALAEPKDKITFADKIAGAKKEVDEMLGDVAANAMKNAIGKIREIENDDVEEGWEDMERDVLKRRQDTSKMKTGDRMAGHKHDIEKTDTGMKVTRRVRPDGISVGADDDTAASGEKRGKGRPKGTGSKMGAKGPSGKSKLMTREDDEYDDEAGMAKQDLTQAKDAAEELRSILASDENLPEWVQAKITKAVDYLDTARDYIKSEKDGEEELDEKKDVKRDNKAEKDGKKVTKDIEYDEKKKDGIHGKKRDSEDNKAEKAGKEVDKDIEHDEKEDKPKKSKGKFNFGGSVYENLDAQLETLINEGMNIDVHMGQGHDGGEDTKSITVTADGDDAMTLAELLKSAGLGQGSSAGCSTCGQSECGCNQVDENSPDWPTNQETSNDALQYSGGLNKPKSTGQSTTPVLASQLRRQVSMEESVKIERSLFDLYKDFTK